MEIICLIPRESKALTAQSLSFLGFFTGGGAGGKKKAALPESSAAKERDPAFTAGGAARAGQRGEALPR